MWEREGWEMASAEPKLTEKGKETVPSNSPKGQSPPTPPRTAPSCSPKGEGCHSDGKPTLKLTLRLMLIRNKDFKRGMKDGDAIKRKEIRYLIE